MRAGALWARARTARATAAFTILVAAAWLVAAFDRYGLDARHESLRLFREREVAGPEDGADAQFACAHGKLAELAEKARAVSFEVNDTRGGTFTISNAGAMGGSRYSTPIINHPQAAVLALGRSRWQPRVVEGKVVPRLILPLSVSFDHRIIDGAHAIAFMREIVNLLERPASLML